MAATAPKQRVISTKQDFHSIKTKWNALVQSCKSSTPFVTWEWLYTWWEIYSDQDTELSILLYETANDCVAIAPFYVRSKESNSICRTVYFLGTGEQEDKEVSSEYLDVIIHPSFSDNEDIFKQTFEYFIGQAGKCINFEFSRILESSTLIHYLEQYSDKKLHVEKIFCGYRYKLKLPESWEDYIASLKSTRRRSIVSASKKINSLGVVKIKFLNDYQEIKDEIKNLEKLHTTYWSQKGKKGAFYSDEFIQFINRISEAFFHLNMLHVMAIENGDRTVAVIYSFIMNKTLYYYQSGFDVSGYRLSIGVYAHSVNIENSINTSIEHYDFMQGKPISYKERYGCKKSKMYNIKVYKNWSNMMLDKVKSKLKQIISY